MRSPPSAPSTFRHSTSRNCCRDQARQELAGLGVDVSAVDDSAGGGVKYASFSDPDGNTLVLQEMAWRIGDAF